MSRAEPRRRKIGPLDCIEVRNSPEAPWVVIFHGFGADMNDLAPLHQAIPVGRPVNWLFPNGHLSVELGPHMEGRAWFPLRMAEIEAAMAAGAGIDLSKQAPPGMKRARENALETLKSLEVPMDRVILGGFSQGAMLATEVALRAEIAPAGLALLSSTLVDSESWSQLAIERKGLKYFMSHGIYDGVLKIEPARQLDALLRNAGLQGKLFEFHGQHEIPLEVMMRLGEFLRGSLPK